MNSRITGLKLNGSHALANGHKTKEVHQMEITTSSNQNDNEDFYRPHIGQLDQCLENHEELQVHFRYRHLTTWSTKLLFDACRRIQQHLRNGKKIETLWHVDQSDQEMTEIGHDLAELYNLKMIFLNN